MRLRGRAVGNRLGAERSPYLQQHAHNPVDWYAWGAEALERARAEDRPILLSIGYSACHWCHVMEHESFDDPETAQLMNGLFVNVKVDREERPDLDSIYMKAVQSLTGRGGWPLTAFLTPDGRPFYGGTYYPPTPRHGLPSFQQVLRAVDEAWRERRNEVEAGADRLRDAVRASMAPEARDAPDWDGTVAQAQRRLLERFDPVYGGFGGAPKFPQPVVLEFLLARYEASGEPRLLDAVVRTLRGLQNGGIHDQLAGGFHRYSVDARWLVPHFEKMLYDNALLARVFVRAAELSGFAEFEHTARTTLDWMLDDLRSPEAGFHSARDADSEGVEGRFYVWTPDEVLEVARAAGLDDELARRFCAFWDVTEEGNFEGFSILHRTHAAAADGDEPADFAPLRRALLERRAQREPPFLDTKVLCSWSALAVRALAEAGAALAEPRYLEAARTGADFLLRAMRADGRLHHVYSHGAPRVDGFLEDYAALGNALWTLHEQAPGEHWLDGALWCRACILADFVDAESGWLYDTARDGEALVVRPRDVVDSALPSGHSLAVEFLLRSSPGNADERGRGVAEQALMSARSAMIRAPDGFGRLLCQAERVRRLAD